MSVVVAFACVCAVTWVLVGCLGDLESIQPTSGADLAAGGGDMARAGEMGGGGAVHFAPDIQKDIDKLGCSLAGCHGGPGQMPSLRPSATSQADIDNNYMSFMTRINQNDAANSIIIQNALGMLSHGGGAVMKSTDPEYTRWVNWIAAGAPKQ